MRCCVAASHLLLFDRVISMPVKLIDSPVVCDLDHKHSVTVLGMFYKIFGNPVYVLKATLPA